MKSIISLESPGTLNFYTVGGGTTCSYGDPRGAPCNGTLFTGNGTIFANAAIKQVQAYNTALNAAGLPQLVGIDLELENGHCSAFILDAATAIKSANLKVSIAPQIVSSQSNLVSTSPQNNVWYSSGGGTGTNYNPPFVGGCQDPSMSVYWGKGGSPANNEYYPAIAAGKVDYIQTQLYNQYGYTIDGTNPMALGSLAKFAQIFSILSSSSCSNGSFPNSSCVPDSVSGVLLGEAVNNQAGAGSEFTVSVPAVPYLTVLNSLTSDIANSLPIMNGMMMWQASADWLYFNNAGATSPGQTSKAFAKSLGIAN